MSSVYDSESIARECMSSESNTDDPVSGTTSVHARISIPVEDLLQQLTSAESRDDDRRIIYVSAERSKGYEASPKATISTTRMPIKARASSLLHVKYNSVSASYEVELNVDIDLPTGEVSRHILDHVRPVADASHVGDQRSTRRENFSDVPMSYIRQLGHDSSTAWQGYKASNKWHRKKHHVRYVLPSKSMFAPDSDFLRGRVSLNADAPEFKPESETCHVSSPTVGYVPMNGWESRQMEEMSLPPQAAEGPFRWLEGNNSTVGVDFGSVSTTGSCYSGVFTSSPLQIPLDMPEDRFDSWRTTTTARLLEAPTGTAVRKESGGSTSVGIDSGYVSSPVTSSSARFHVD